MTACLTYQKNILFQQYAFILSVTNLNMRPTPADYQDLDVQTDRSNVKIVDGTLIIKNIQKSHEGYYLCKASNGIGGISAVAKLSVQGKRGRPFNASHISRDLKSAPPPHSKKNIANLNLHSKDPFLHYHFKCNGIQTVHFYIQYIQL